MSQHENLDTLKTSLSDLSQLFDVTTCHHFLADSIGLSAFKCPSSSSSLKASFSPASGNFPRILSMNSAARKATRPSWLALALQALSSVRSRTSGPTSIWKNTSLTPTFERFGANSCTKKDTKTIHLVCHVQTFSG